MIHDPPQPDTHEPAITTVAAEPKRRVFRRLTFSGRLADFAWRWSYRLLFRPSPFSADGWRRMILRMFKAKIAPSAVIHRNVRIIHPWNLTVEDHAVILHGAILDCQAPVHIGKGACISQLAHLCTATHEYQDRHMPIVGKPIKIGQGCWLAADVFVGSGVGIGDGAVIGARASVFRDVQPGMLMVGSPARKSRRRVPDPQSHDHMQPQPGGVT